MLCQNMKTVNPKISMAVLYQGHTLILKPLLPEILLKGLKKSLKNRRQTDEEFYLHISYRNIWGKATIEY